ncbi:MAG: aldo/keto reductase family protein [Candidatus Kariarchaeaceae archaeon]|jgi:diketogulonate reductase-like aldo/keto reductase
MSNLIINPFFMYGTAWKESQTEELTLLALQSGFRAIDTANQRKHYFEEGVGKGIARFLESGDFKRKDLFIQTKFTYKEGQDIRLPYDPKADYPVQVKQSFQSSLDHLKTDYIDSYILHGPLTRKGLTSADYEVWETMETLQKDGLTKYIGVSNVDANQLQSLLDKVSIKPTFVQNRCFAQLGWDLTIRKICYENDIIYQGFSLLTANRQFIFDPKIAQIAENYGVPIPSIIFSFSKQVGMMPMTGTSNQVHMNQDLSGIDIKLKDKEIHLIENIARPIP